MRLPTVVRQPITAAFVIGVLLEGHPSEGQRFPAELAYGRYTVTMRATGGSVTITPPTGHLGLGSDAPVPAISTAL